MKVFDRIEKAIENFRQRKFVIIYSESEKEGDLCIPGEEITAAAVLFMARVASGLICLALPRKRLENLEIEPLRSRYRAEDTPFYEPVDAVGVGSGISPKDRAATIRQVIDPSTKPADLARPGHVPLLGAEPLGLLKRDGHTEAVLELAKMSGLYPAAVLCELISDSGDAMNAKELKALAKKFNIPIITVGALSKFARSLIRKSGLDK